MLRRMCASTVSVRGQWAIFTIKDRTDGSELGHGLVSQNAHHRFRALDLPSRCRGQSRRPLSCCCICVAAVFGSTEYRERREVVPSRESRKLQMERLRKAHRRLGVYSSSSDEEVRLNFWPCSAAQPVMKRKCVRDR